LKCFVIFIQLVTLFAFTSWILTTFDSKTFDDIKNNTYGDRVSIGFNIAFLFITFILSFFKGNYSTLAMGSMFVLFLILSIFFQTKYIKSSILCFYCAIGIFFMFFINGSSEFLKISTKNEEIINEYFFRALTFLLGGGISGFFAGIVQVLLLMWLRTTMNYQYRNGGSTRDALAALYAEGGLRRFYRGVSFALIQTPLSRFGDTAANTGVLALLADSTLPVGVRTAFASAAAAAWRIGLTPIDTLKTTLQVKGAEGYDQVSAKVTSKCSEESDQAVLGVARWRIGRPPPSLAGRASVPRAHAASSICQPWPRQRPRQPARVPRRLPRRRPRRRRARGGTGRR
jgi:hypothetical protein